MKGLSPTTFSRFINITGPYYKGANGILILYDITYQESFNNIQNWLRTVDRYASEDVSTFLVGMKCDLEYKRVVPYESGKDLVDRLGMDGFIEVSAQNMINVDECFQMVVKCLLSHEVSFFFLFFLLSFGGNLSFFFFFFFFFVCSTNRVKLAYILHVGRVKRRLWLVYWIKRLTWKLRIL